jgi:hypothetical protein
MAGITALSDTYNTPNFGGDLYRVSPAETPFLSAIGGLNGGGGQTTDTQYEWQTYDFRTRSQPSNLEGADAPAEQTRVRAVVSNVCQIHHETVGVSYTKLAAIGRKAGLANMQQNPVADEMVWQLRQALVQVAGDVNYSLINGIYQMPADNLTARRTRGVMSAIATNVIDATAAVPNGVGAAAAAVGDTITANGHGLVNGDQVLFTSVGTATPLVTVPTVWSPASPTAGVYYVISSAANTFQVALTDGGAAVNITADGVVTVRKRQALTVNMINRMMQAAFTGGGSWNPLTATLLCGASQKRMVTAAYTAAGYVTKELLGEVGGVNVTQIDTDFGRFNIMLDPDMRPDQLAGVRMEQCRPVFLDIPGKGHMFPEPLAKTGAKDRSQIYGEVGLAYGNEAAHAKITGLKLAD